MPCYPESAGCYNPFQPYTPCAPSYGCAPPCAPSYNPYMACSPCVTPCATVCDSTVANLTTTGTAIIGTTLTVMGATSTKNLTLTGKLAVVVTASPATLSAKSGSFSYTPPPTLAAGVVDDLTLQLVGVKDTSVVLLTVRSYTSSTPGAILQVTAIPANDIITVEFKNVGATAFTDLGVVTVMYVVL